MKHLSIHLSKIDLINLSSVLQDFFCMLSTLWRNSSNPYDDKKCIEVLCPKIGINPLIFSDGQQDLQIRSHWSSNFGALVDGRMRINYGFLKDFGVFAVGGKLLWVCQKTIHCQIRGHKQNFRDPQVDGFVWKWCTPNSTSLSSFFLFQWQIWG